MELGPPCDDNGATKPCSKTMLGWIAVGIVACVVIPILYRRHRRFEGLFRDMEHCIAKMDEAILNGDNDSFSRWAERCDEISEHVKWLMR